MSKDNGNGTGPRILSAAEILSATQLEEKIVEIPELGGAVKIREFDKGRQQWLRSQATDKRTGKVDTSKLELFIFAYGVVEPTFNLGEIENLRKVKASIIDRVNGEISRLSGMTDEAVEEEAEMFQE